MFNFFRKKVVPCERSHEAENAICSVQRVHYRPFYDSRWRCWDKRTQKATIITRQNDETADNLLLLVTNAIKNGTLRNLDERSKIYYD